ncbi:MAG: hypothetical protein MRERC_2c087 [Mycoplasmataceae bacterium RC_NB112A]|nr:MAG: hypothetical protein MRERC_2c087 [Mycoplasmataceae bacterium RC_NB112A]
MANSYKTFKRTSGSSITFPSLKELELIRGKIKSFPNQKKERLRKIHYGCYLLCSQADLRVSEAIKFDLNSKSSKGLYRINKPKKTVGEISLCSFGSYSWVKIPKLKI